MTSLPQAIVAIGILVLAGFCVYESSPILAFICIIGAIEIAD